RGNLDSSGCLGTWGSRSASPGAPAHASAKIVVFHNRSSIMSTTEIKPVQRVRHPFRARHVQLLAREALSPGFVRLTVGGDELRDFFSPGFDDHVKLILPQAGLEKPRLPVMVDGRPRIDGERPTMRDYTPLRFDAASNTLLLDF